MQLQKFGHSCLLVTSGDARLLFDPGTFSKGFEDLRDLTAILITHQHPDHLDPERLPRLLERNPQAELIADEQSTQQLAERGLRATVARPGETLNPGCPVVVGGGMHAEIHPDIPRISNVGYLIDGRLWHPGDSLVTPPDPPEILALPAVAPWMRVAQTIDYYREVRPRIAVPIHDAITTVPQLYDGMLTSLGPEGSELRRIDDRGAIDL